MTHPCNNPNLSPEEFLQRVMVDDTFSMALRVKAAAALTSIQTKAPVPPITIHIKDPYSYEYLARFPWLKEFATKDPEQVNTISQSKDRIRPDNPQLSSETPGPLNTETPSPPQTFKPFLSTPGPSYIEHTEILQVKAAVNKLRPDLAHLPLPDQFYHCSCWDCWFTFPCDCPRDASKLN